MQTRSKLLKRIFRQRELFFMIIPIMIYVFIIHYLPLKGWEMAFQRVRPGRESPWVGFEHFQFLFSDKLFGRIMRNTLAMSVINLVFGFVFAILLALLINEIRQKAFKRVVQTISYLPHFLSWVIASSLIADFLASNGTLNRLLMALGISDKPDIFLGNPNYFWWIVGWSNVWKSVGWNTIIYLAAITSIDPELYESAELDGAGRFAKIWHITLPGIKSTILVLIIMNMGWILNAGFEIQYLLSNGLTRETAWTIDVFVIEYGIRQRNYSLGTAMGMFKTVVSVILIAGTNQLSKRFAQESLV